jgi:hypothetical protein
MKQEIRIIRMLIVITCTFSAGIIIAMFVAAGYL